MSDHNAEGVSDPALLDLAANLRSEWQADYDETAGEARMQWEHGRTVIDRIHDAMARGDRMQFSVGDVSFAGPVTNLGTDWCTVETSAGPVDVRLAFHAAQVGAPVVIRRLERGRAGGMRAPQPPMGFRARCYELEMDGRPVRVGSARSDAVLTGRLTVGADHLVVTNDDGDAILSLDWIGWIVAD